MGRIAYIVFILISNICYGQWGINKQYSSFTEGLSTSFSSIDNSIYVSGYFTGPSSSATKTRGGFLAKYDTQGSLLWEKEYYSAKTAVGAHNILDKNGNVLVSANFVSNIEFENDSFTGQGMILLKYDPAGTLLFKLHEPYAFAYSVCSDSSNNIYVAGYFNTDGDSVFNGQSFKHETFLAKYDEYGNFLWVRNFLCFVYNENAFDMCVDGQGNIYTTGIFSQYGYNYITDSIQLVNTGSFDGYIAKYDSTIELQWVKTIKGSNAEVPSRIAISQKGDIYIGGYYASNSNYFNHYFDSIVIQGNPNNYGDIFIAKYNSSGNCQWVRTAGGNGSDYAKGIYVDKSGDAFLTGYFGWHGDSAVFGNQTFYCNNGIRMYLAQYDFNGNLKWVEASQGGEGYSQDITGSGQGDLYITGAFLGNWNFGPVSLIGYEEMFLLKMDYNTGNSIGNELFQDNSGLLVYPNPTSGVFTVSLTEISLETKICIYDVLGKCVLPQINVKNGQQINLTGKPPGIYFVEVVLGAERRMRKIILE